jgi:hypothetical protein
VAPIALYPDALVAQILAAATYPTQVVEADRWRQAQGNLAPDQIAAAAESQNWDPSIKALTTFPTVLAQMDQNLRWTTDLGNAYYNQPQDVMNSIQAMRQKAKAAGQLRSTPQQVVSDSGGAISIAPVNPAVVYVPIYNPWGVYGAPVAVYPGYYAPSQGDFWGGMAVGFGVGIGVAFLARWAWGWGGWGLGWFNHSIFFNHSPYFTRSTTVLNRGLNLPGGPAKGFPTRGVYARAHTGFNRSGGYGERTPGYHGGSGYRPGDYPGHPNGTFGRPGGAVPRPPVNSYRPPVSSYRASVPRPPGSSYRPPADYRFSGSSARASRDMGRSAERSYNFAGNRNYGGNDGHFSGSPRMSSPHASAKNSEKAFSGGGHLGGHGGGGHSGGGHSSGGHGGGHHRG